MRAIIIHGTMGSAEGNWYPWLADKLRELGVDVVVPQLPTPENQNLAAWTAEFAAKCGEITEDTVLIGHSCGAVLIMRLLERSERAAACTVLVAPPYKTIGMPEIDELNTTFLADPFDWSKIVANAGELAYFMADNDQYVPQDQLLEIAKQLKITPILIRGGGHLNIETGYDTFPELLTYLQSFFLNRSS